jgi:hypothetical protein
MVATITTTIRNNARKLRDGSVILSNSATRANSYRETKSAIYEKTGLSRASATRVLPRNITTVAASTRTTARKKVLCSPTAPNYKIRELNAATGKIFPRRTRVICELVAV